MEFTKMKKIHIQLEPYNGIKFDFIEVEVESLSEIKEIYKELDELFPNRQPQAQQTMKQDTPFFGGGELASQGQKKYMKSLGIAFTNSTTKQEAIELIKNGLNNK